MEVIRQEPPAYEGCFLHRDFHPGNVLFRGTGEDCRISGVVDWVETSCGEDHLYWRLIDALSYSPDAAKFAGPWRELGRTELTPEALGGRRTADVEGLLES